MDLTEQIANAFARALGPIADHFGATLGEAVTEKLPEKLAQKLSGKEIQITIKLPNMTKENGQ